MVPRSRVCEAQKLSHNRLTSRRRWPTNEKREIRAPAVGNDEPRTQTPPCPHVLAAVGLDGAIGLPDGDGVAPDLDRHVARRVDADGFEAQVFVSGLAELAQQVLDGLWDRRQDRGAAP